jgi:lactate dehydrogenase-like 2-hydroxyacid dehydrogenase
MARPSDKDSAVQRTVVTPYAIPEWAALPADEFDLHRFTADCTICRASKVMLTSGTQPVGREIIDQLPALRYICCLGSGYEGVDTDYAAQRGIVVSNSASVTASDVADQLVAITLALCLQIPSLDRAVRLGAWPKPVRRSFRDHKVGIVGFGAIGEAAAQRVAAFGCEIRWTGRRPKDVPYAYCPDLLDLAEWADILFITARADETNCHLIGRDVFDKLGPDGILANISRGSIVDEDALIRALRSGRIGGAALDVFEQEPTPAGRWDNVPNTVLSPHVGGFTTGVRSGILQLVIRNLRAFFSEDEIVGAVSGQHEQSRPGPPRHGNAFEREEHAR